MTTSEDYLEYLKELLSELGPIEFRRMFGGAGLFRDGLMFGLVADGSLYLKADQRNWPDFEAAGMEPFVYGRGERRIAMSYYLAPPEVLEDAERAVGWARKALDAALAVRKDPKAGRSRPKL